MQDMFGIKSLRYRAWFDRTDKAEHRAQLRSALWTLDTSGLVTVVYLLPVTTIVKSSDEGICGVPVRCQLDRPVRLKAGCVYTEASLLVPPGIEFRELGVRVDVSNTEHHVSIGAGHGMGRVKGRDPHGSPGVPCRGAESLRGHPQLIVRPPDSDRKPIRDIIHRNAG